VHLFFPKKPNQTGYFEPLQIPGFQKRPLHLLLPVGQNSASCPGGTARCGRPQLPSASLSGAVLAAKGCTNPGKGKFTLGFHDAAAWRCRELQSHVQGEYTAPGEKERPLVGSPFSLHPKSHNELPRWNLQAGYFPAQSHSVAAAEKGTAMFSSWHFLMGSQGRDRPAMRNGAHWAEGLDVSKGKIICFPYTSSLNSN